MSAYSKVNNRAVHCYQTVGSNCMEWEGFGVQVRSTKVAQGRRRHQPGQMWRYRLEPTAAIQACCLISSYPWILISFFASRAGVSSAKSCPDGWLPVSESVQFGGQKAKIAFICAIIDRLGKYVAGALIVFAAEFEV